MRTAESPGRKITARPANHHAHISMAARKAERAHICELLRELIDTAKEKHTSPLETCSVIERLIAMLTSQDEPKEPVQ
ncbi:hypothetical protein P2R21_10425 [Escherichia coli]|uniref:hypothetical protein n=1 Tax=Escherichia coli TaxID=562 RepID=UPI001CD9D074|nr:hypothetical protein [Escherichia coli]EHR4991344.1 hypothetical protein [Escherichia coli]MCA2041174.1 hypothetical protein [Escherichia coli]MCA2058914.1 hypothetical protein [Escherichia coli]MCA2126142.1 hypothetical protein [Escherichia coli]MCK2672185.1 hypothetical protein [Escherichia coli]